EDLPVGVKQRVEIVKTLYRGADIIIFDEPTAVLTPPEVEELFQVFHELIKHNKTIVFITHKLNETMTVAHRISVLRNGRKIRTLAREETTPEELARLMVGREVAFDLEKSPCRPGKTILALQKVQLLPKAARTVDLEVRAGEIVGIAGVEGNGQLELEEMIMGLMPCPGGKILFNGQDITGLSVRERKSLGMAHIPSDRHKRAMLAGFSLEENLLLGRQFRPEWVRRGVIRQQALRQSCRQLIETFKIKASGAQQKIKFLSGGNQQKVILAREVSAGPELILAAQPTRGLDIGAIEYIHKLLLELRDQGKGILLISAELPEIMKLSDRIAVLYEGEIRALGPAEEFTQEELGLLMAGRERGEAS
ncbi:MAG TPA: ATP-binding cassette domain-containing protein, partial [Clostridia bacterium]|nr:ATP-binding cassette domain-containing protein [Clostridia bacterium]